MITLTREQIERDAMKFARDHDLIDFVALLYINNVACVIDNIDDANMSMKSFDDIANAHDYFVRRVSIL